MAGVEGLAFSDASGLNRGYTGLWIGNVTEPFGEGGRSRSLRRDMFRAAKKDEQVPTTVQVAQGVPFLSGSLLDQDGVSVPPGVVVTVTRPDGTTLPSTDTWSNDLIVHHDTEGNLAGFLISQPQPGTWTIQTSVPAGNEPNFQLFVSTLPTGDDQADMTQTLESAFGEKFTAEQVDAIIAQYGLVSWGCFWCTVGVWTVAVIIVVAVTVALGYLTVQSGAVVALAGWAGVSAAAALVFIRTLVSLAVMGVNAVVTRICQWTGACS